MVQCLTVTGLTVMEPHYKKHSGQSEYICVVGNKMTNKYFARKTEWDKRCVKSK